MVPGSTVSQVNSRCHVVRGEGLRSVFLDGRALLAYDVGDKVSERIAIMQLYTCGHAMQQDLAEAFGYDKSTIRRWIGRWKAGGFDGLLNKTPKRTPYKMKGRDGTVRRMVLEGLSNCEIGRRLGVDEGTVRQALKRLGIRRRKASEPVLPGLEPESPEVSSTQPTGTETASEPPHDHVPADLSAPVPATDSDPSDRSGDRALAAAGALHDATPLFGDADSVPGAGILLAVPAIWRAAFWTAFARRTARSAPPSTACARWL